MASNLTLEQEASRLEQIIEACGDRLTQREEIKFAKGVYYAPADPSFVVDADKLFPDRHLMPLPEQIADLKFERIGISEYRVSLV